MFKLFAKALSKEEQEAILAAKLTWILAQASPVEIILFGSAANYEMTDASDVDLIVIFANKDERDMARQRLFKSRPKDDWPHDLLLLTKEEFLKSAAQGGGAAYVAQQEGRTIFPKGVGS
jgi:predicted nucleotidyltransferase